MRYFLLRQTDWMRSLPPSQLHLKGSINRPLSADHSPLSCQSRAGRDNLGAVIIWERNWKIQMGVWVKQSKKEQNVFWQEGSSKPKQFSLSHNQCQMLMRAAARAGLSTAGASPAVGLRMLTCNPRLCVGALTSAKQPAVCLSELSWEFSQIEWN